MKEEKFRLDWEPLKNKDRPAIEKYLAEHPEYKLIINELTIIKNGMVAFESVARMLLGEVKIIKEKLEKLFEFNKKLEKHLKTEKQQSNIIVPQMHVKAKSKDLIG